MKKQAITAYWKKHGIVSVMGFILLVLLVYIFYNLANEEQAEVYQVPDTESLIDDRSSVGTRTPAGEVVFCFQLDGRRDGHLPHLLGEDQPNTYYNGDGGYNYSMKPTATGDEDFGVMADGTIFASEDWLLACGMMNEVYLISGVTGWTAKKMEKEGDLYVYRRQ